MYVLYIIYIFVCVIDGWCMRGVYHQQCICFLLKPGWYPFKWRPYVSRDTPWLQTQRFSDVTSSLSFSLSLSLSLALSLFLFLSFPLSPPLSLSGKKNLFYVAVPQNLSGSFDSKTASGQSHLTAWFLRFNLEIKNDHQASPWHLSGTFCAKTDVTNHTLVQPSPLQILFVLRACWGHLFLFEPDILSKLFCFVLLVL